MSPGCVTERLFFFVAEYSENLRVTSGGLASDGEDIDVLEVSLDDALAMIESGEIVDAKTVILLQYAKLHRLCEP